MMHGDLPPSSRETFFKFDFAAAHMTMRPTSVEPVKATLSIFGCSEIAAPAVGPKPKNQQKVEEITLTWDHVDDASGVASLLDQLANVESCQRSLLGWFHNDNVTHRKGWPEFPGEHKKGKVPWDNLTDNTDRFVKSHRKVLSIDGNSFTVVLVSPAGIVSQTLDREFQISMVGNLRMFIC